MKRNTCALSNQENRACALLKYSDLGENINGIDNIAFEKKEGGRNDRREGGG